MTEKLLKTYAGKYVSLQTTREGIVDEYVGFLVCKNNRFYMCACLAFMTLKILIDYRDVTFICEWEEDDEERSRTEKTV